MNYAEITDHDGIKQTPWILLSNGDEICYLTSFEHKTMRYVLVTGHGYDHEREAMKQDALEKNINEMRA